MNEIILNDIIKEYNGRTVLEIKELIFQKGRIYGIIGPNGSGKTTLLDSIAERTAGVAYMPQKPYIFDMSVLKNVLLGAGPEMDREEAGIAALEALGRVDMESFINARASRLSGGEAQRTALARTLMDPREFILLDEPASAIDVAGMQAVEKYITEIRREKGPGIIFTTHNPSQAFRMADEIIFLMNGKIIERGSPEVFKNPVRKETAEFLRFWSGGLN